MDMAVMVGGFLVTIVTVIGSVWWFSIKAAWGVAQREARLEYVEKEGVRHENDIGTLFGVVDGHGERISKIEGICATRGADCGG